MTAPRPKPAPTVEIIPTDTPGALSGLAKLLILLAETDPQENEGGAAA